MDAGAPIAAVLCAAVLAVACSVEHAEDISSADARDVEVIDLTHVLDEHFPYIPVPGVTFPFKLIPIATIEGHGVAANRWEIHEHIGTQIDAPSHFVPGGASLDALPADTLVVPLAVVDISARAGLDPDTALTIADIAAWETAHGRLPDRAAVFVYSGWESRIADPARFINADQSGTMHFPGISPEAAAFLATERRAASIGVDTLSIDPGVDRGFRTHRYWLAQGKWAAEVVANLRSVPLNGATLFAGAPRVRGATGGPVRLLATVPRSRGPR